MRWATPSRVLALVAAGVLAAGCGSSGGEAADTHDAPKSSTSQGSPAAQNPDPPPDPNAPADGEMVVFYDMATTPEATNGRNIMQNDQLLEALANDINETLKLPHNISLRGSQCGEPNAFWSADDNTITLCYEDVDWAQRVFTEAGDPDPKASALNSEYATFYHEVGHMAISIYDLPVTGREEDVADQLAAFVLLAPGEDGHADPESVQAVKDFARAFGASGAQATELTADDFADEHSLDETRMYNLECWIYGSDPKANADLVTSGELPKDRASGCPAEWEQLDQAWSTLLDPYFK
ncbi:DUF4344 domain-containing metallopeptidase [Mycobacterium neumannii]|uniref:DUF4344 domain-containing metallopeptidase n=1 Tax=Mycobacterium neumannii TaxID=2048551 RepID=UPI003AB4BFE4